MRGCAVYIIVAAALWFGVAAKVQGAQYAVSSTFAPAAAGEPFEALIGVDTEGERLNLFDVAVDIPPGVEIVEFIKEGSVVNLWIKEPEFDAPTRTLSFIGAVPGGFLGRAALGRFKAQAKQEGTYTFSVNPRSGAYLNDGQGTLAAVAGQTLNFKVGRGVSPVEGASRLGLPARRAGVAGGTVVVLFLLSWWFWRRRRSGARRSRFLPLLWVGWGFTFTALFFPASAQGGSLVRLFLDPAARSLAAGQEFEVTVKIESQDRAINAVEAVLDYPADWLKIARLDSDNSFVKIWVERPAFQDRGRLRLSGGLPTPGFKGAGEIIRLRFKALKTGDPVVNFISGSALANDGNGTNILDELQGGHYTIGPALLIPEAPPYEAPVPEVKKAVPSAPIAPPAIFPVGAPERAAPAQIPPAGAAPSPSGAAVFRAPPTLARLELAFDQDALDSVLASLPAGVKFSYIPVIIRLEGSVAPEDFDRLGFIEFTITSNPIVRRFRLTSPQWSYELRELLPLGEHTITVAAIDLFGAQTASSSLARFIVALPPCFDDKDNDGDAFVDYPQDPGCEARADTTEEETLVAVFAPLVSAETEEKIRGAVLKVQTSKAYEILDVKVVNNPAVEEVNVKVAAPANAAVSAMNVALAVRLKALITHLQGIFTQPILLLRRRRRKEKEKETLRLEESHVAAILSRKMRLHHAIAWSGPLLAMLSVAISPAFSTIALMWVQFALLAIFKALAEAGHGRA